MNRILLLLIITFTFATNTFSQNITNKLGTNGYFMVTDATGTPNYFIVKKSTGDVGIGSNSFDATNPEQLLVDCGTTSSVNAIYSRGTINNYLQFNIRNLSSGNQASSDIVATSDNGTESTNYMDIGINGSGYVNQAGNLGRSNDCYIIGAGNDLYVVNSNSGKDMIFMTGGSATTNERMRIRSNGNVGIGSTTAYNLLSMKYGAFSDGTLWYNASDSTLKRDITDMQKYGLAELMKMRPVSYYYKSDSTNKLEIGFIAQEMKLIIPEVVSGDEGNMGISYGNLVPVLVNAIKEQQSKIDSQQKEIENIKTDIQSLKSTNKTEIAGMNSTGANTVYLLLLSFIAGSVIAVVIKKRK